MIMNARFAQDDTDLFVEQDSGENDYERPLRSG
jgi:hypothetical protein